MNIPVNLKPGDTATIQIQDENRTFVITVKKRTRKSTTIPPITEDVPCFGISYSKTAAECQYQCMRAFSCASIYDAKAIPRTPYERGNTKL